MLQQAHLLILKEHLHPHPLVPSKHVLQEAVPNWLSFSASPISRLSGRLQFGPHVEVTATAQLFSDIYAELATVLSVKPAIPPTLIDSKDFCLSQLF